MSASNLDFSGYLKSIETHYEKWWEIDALTAAIEAQQASFTFKQKVQTEEKDPFADPEDRTKIRTLDLIPGIQEYATVEPVLLVGSPGVGKSSALLRCLVEYAKQELAKPEPKRIPVLIRLKNYQGNLISSDDPAGMLALIKNALKPKFKRRIEISEIEEWLFEGRLILLLDGLNEMPSSSVRTQLQFFCEDLDQTSLICSTRELGAGDLGINRKLVIQPPDREEIDRFLRECIPTAQVQKVEHLLNRDRRELSRTPFVLWMLYHVIQETGAVADTLGEAFRQFFQSFKGRLETAPVTDERRKAWDRWLKHLAFTMLSSPEPTDPGLVISEEDAETALFEEFPPPYETPSLSELLKYHLLQEEKGKITFHHQLIQEYYAAEALLLKLDNFTDEELKRHYLNYLKWTEPIALMLALLEDNAKASEVVQWALEVDLMLGARLAGEVKPEFQDRAVSCINNFELPHWLRVTLLGETKSEASVAKVIEVLENLNHHSRIQDSEASVTEHSKAVEDEEFDKVLEDENSDAHIRDIAIVALGKIGSEIAVPSLIGELEERELSLDAHFLAREALGQMRSEKVNSLLLDLLQSSSNKRLRRHIASALGKAKSKKAVPSLLTLLDDLDEETRLCAAYALRDINSEESLPGFLKALDDPDAEIYCSVVELLQDIGEEKVIPILAKLFQDSDYAARYYATFALGLLKSKAAVSTILKALKDPDWAVRERAAWVLGYMGLEVVCAEIAVPVLCEMLSAPIVEVRIRAAFSLCKFNSAAAIPTLLDVMQQADFGEQWDLEEALGMITSEAAVPLFLEGIENTEVRWTAARLLGKLGSRSAIPKLFSLLEHDAHDVRISATAALGYLGLEALPGLFKAIEDPIPDVRKTAAEALTNIGSEQAINALLKALEDTNDEVRSAVVWAIGYCGSENNVPRLIKSLSKDRYSGVRMNAARALGKIKSDTAVPALLKALEDSDYYDCESAVWALGEIGSDAAISALAKALEHANSEIRWSVANALGETGSDVAIPILSKALQDLEAEVRECAVEALGRISTDAVIPLLIEVINRPDEGCHRIALQALGQVKSKTIISELIKLTKHSSSNVRINAVLALCEYDFKEAAPTFITKIADPDRGIRQFSAEALVKVADKSVIEHLPTLMKLRLGEKGHHPHQAILGIQSNCKFYNYEIYQQVKTRSEQVGHQQNNMTQQIYQIGSVGNLNTGNVYNRGDQVGTKHQQVTNVENTLINEEVNS